MPILWRYLSIQYIKMALFCVAAFVAILLTVRLDEIAHFIALGAPIHYVVKFTLYQIPYILPIAIPISCLIAALILVQRLSSSHELTALRASGFALRDLMAPILITAAIISLLNFWIISELATHSHLTTNQLKNELRGVNPLLLLHNKHLMRLKGIYFEALGVSRVGESASDVILAIPDKHHHRISLFIAKQLQATPSAFIGDRTTMISSLKSPSNETEQFDHLLVENIKESSTSVQDFAQILQKKVWTINNDYLKMSMLLARIEELRHQLANAKEAHDHPKVKQIYTELGKSIADIARRVSMALSVFSFTLMGLAFGIQIGRQQKRRGLFIVIALTTFYLICFFTAKGLDRNWFLAMTLYLVPPMMLVGISTWTLYRIARGIE